MEKTYKQIEGEDMGIIIGGFGVWPPDTVHLYKPINNSVPSTDMDGKRLFRECLKGVGEFVNIPYNVVRQVIVDGLLVWKNMRSFDLQSEGIDPSGQVYWGRGKVRIEFIDDLERVTTNELIEKVISRGAGLRVVE